jgi:hypothetical protein
MKHMTGAVRSSLRWVQPRQSERRFDLRNREGLVATLSFRNASGTFASARSADGRWTFKRVGRWQTRATVRAEGTTADLAGFDHHTWGGGGTIRLADGRAIRVTVSLRQRAVECQFTEGHPLFRYRTDGLPLRQSDVDVLQPLEGMPEMPWLLLFGWYLVVMMYQDSTTHVAMVG